MSKIPLLSFRETLEYTTKGNANAVITVGIIKDELNLSDTKISEQNDDLGNYWDWDSDDAYLPAGAVTSNINDMLGLCSNAA